ncbi:MAG: hypothetical protein II984_07890 [Clostridia bacterium]|nr:hypothetical protein [Clostridia bacterium]
MYDDDKDLIDFLEELEKMVARDKEEGFDTFEIEKPKKTLYEKENFSLDFSVGYDDNGDAVNLNLIEAPHLLVGGNSTHWALLNILYQLTTEYVDKVDFVICGKKEKYREFNPLPCVINEITDDDNYVSGILRYMVTEMEHRFELMEQSLVRNIAEYNGKYSNDTRKQMKRIVIAIDDYDRLFSLNREVGNGIIRLTQKARAAGIHIILGSTNIDISSVNRYTLANIPVQLVSKVKDRNASISCLGQGGAEKLNDNEALLSSYSYKLQRVSLESEPFDTSRLSFYYWDDDCKSKELQVFVDNYIKSLKPIDGDLLNEVREFVKTIDCFYISVIQRKFKIGYYKAREILNQLMREGVVYRERPGKPYYNIK